MSMAIRAGRSIYSKNRSKKPRAISGIDLPEVAPVQGGLEVTQLERSPSVAPQYVHKRYASGIEAVYPEDTKGASSSTLEPDDSASTRGFFPSPNKPHNVVRPPFWKNKRVRRWLIGGAFIIAILLAIVISVAVTQSLSHEPTPTAPSVRPGETLIVTASSAPTTASSPSSTSGCPTYTGPAMSTLPTSIPRPGGPAPIPPTANKAVTISFNQDFSYDVADKDTSVTNDAFTSISQGFAYALGNDGESSQIVINSFTPVDTTPEQCYIATQGTVEMPEDLAGQLQQQAGADRRDSSVRLWNNPNGNIRSLFEKIGNITF